MKYVDRAAILLDSSSSKRLIQEVNLHIYRNSLLNTSSKSRNFIYVGTAAVLVTVAGALVQFLTPRAREPEPPRQIVSAPPVWEASSVLPEPKLAPESVAKVIPVPPLPDDSFKFRQLPKVKHEAPRGVVEQHAIPSLPRLAPAQNNAQKVQSPTFRPLPVFNTSASHNAELKTRRAPGLETPGKTQPKPSGSGGLFTSESPIQAGVSQTELNKPNTNQKRGEGLVSIFETDAVDSAQQARSTGSDDANLDDAVAVSTPEPVAADQPFKGRALRVLKGEESLLPEIKLATALVLAQPAVPTPAVPTPVTGKKKKKVVVAAPRKDRNTGASAKPSLLPAGKDEFRLAAQPQVGAHYVEDQPQVGDGVQLVEPLLSDFSPDAIPSDMAYEPSPQMNVYEGKTLNANQRPLVELGRPWYQLGQLSPGSSVLGFHNNVTPQFLIFGDHRTAYASNRSNGNSTSQIATQLNLDFDLKLTGTERFHAFVQPLSSGGRNTRYLFGENDMSFEGSANPAFGYFEGDLGAIVGGAVNKTLPFDLPFAAGVIPLVFQNGVWFEDAILGVAATLPAKNSPRFNISNMDITFFAGYDKIDSPAFEGDDSAARIMGVASFIEMLNGYIEIDYAFLDDRTFADRSYHNISAAYSRRYGRFISNSTRVIVNAGQNAGAGGNTADGVLLLSENSLITGAPSNVVPYFNLFAGFDRPQSAARAGIAGGVLRNTGILFESDNLTGYPTLDATANDTYGMSLGLNILSGGDRFSQQLVVETSMLGVMGDAATRNAKGDQYGVGFRYQLPLSNSVIFRADGMMGFLRNDDDISGFRMELRKKF